MQSRSFGLEDNASPGRYRHLLMPLADMLNHGDEELGTYRGGVGALELSQRTDNLEWKVEAAPDALYFVSTTAMEANTVGSEQSVKSQSAVGDV